MSNPALRGWLARTNSRLRPEPPCVQYLFPMAQEAAPMVESQLSLTGFAEIASKRANRICCGDGVQELHCPFVHDQP
jgi:hypothetical protein